MVTRDPGPRYRGRDAEIRVLGGAMEEAASGRLTGVIVEGEAGIGKSRLLSEALAAARDRGYQSASGRAEELERTRPFGVLVDAFDCSASSSDPRRTAIAGLLATHAGDGGAVTVTSDPGLQFQAVDAFVDLVEAEALRRPLVIGVDDLQWADPSTLLTLDALARRLAYVPVAIIGCMRPAPRVGELERMIDTLLAAGAHPLRLGQLGEQAMTDLVAEIVRAQPGPRLLAEVSGAGGNPLFVTELVSALVEEGAIEIADGQAEVAEAILPPSLRLTILRRLSFLSGDTLDLLGSASILGSSFTLTELSTVTTRPAFDLAPALEEAFTARVLTDDGDRVRFRHDLIRDAVYEDLPPSLRVGLHREAGQRLARSNGSAVRVAEHFARAAERGDAEAIAWLTRAGREAASTSPDIAADLLQRAIGLTYSSDADRDALLAERAGILMWAGRIAEAEATCRSLLNRPHDPAVDASAQLCLGRCLLTAGRMQEALRELELVRRSPTATDVQKAASWGWASIAYMTLGHLYDAAAAAEQARSAAIRAGDDAMSSMTLTVLALIKEFRALFHDALEMSDEGVRRADGSSQRQGHRYPHHLVRAQILLGLDRFADARAALETGMRVSEELGVRWPLAAYHTILAAERFAGGEWDDAISAFEAGLELTDETGERNNLVLGHSVLSLIALHRNDLERAAQAASAAGREFAGSGPGYRGHWSQWVRALLLEADGDTAQAFATLAEGWDRCASSGLAIEYPGLGPDLVRLALAAGEHTRADQVTSAVAAVAASNDVPSLTGAALRCQGLLHTDPDTLRAAVDSYSQSPRPLELALVCEDAGTVLGRTGDLDAAIPLLDRALEIYAQLDAARDIARSRSVLRELGVRRGRRGTRNRPRMGWDSLTPTERNVTDLVAEGLSNPQIGDRLFVSRRTVQTHLAHVFRKLQMSSRTELAAAVTHRSES